MNNAAAIMTGPAAQWLSVRLGQQDFAVDVGCVRELRRYQPPTRVPQSPSFMLGLLDIRGMLIPVIDLGLRLGLPAAVAGGQSIIVVIHGPRGTVGLLVDKVGDLLSLPSDALHFPPSFSPDVKTGFVGGAITVDGRIVNILRTENIANVEQVA